MLGTVFVARREVVMADAPIRGGRYPAVPAPLWSKFRWGFEIARHLWVADALTKSGFHRIVDFIQLCGLQLDGNQWHVLADSAPNQIAQLCDRYGSDKGDAGASIQPYPWPSHTYADVYGLILSPQRHAIRTVLECGIGTNNPSFTSSMTATGRPGASLRVWRDFFPNALVFGVDIDPDILFEEDRIRTAHVDQTSQDSIAAFLKEEGRPIFDVIIDDGLHEFSANRTFFESMIGSLAPGGYYFIEDCVAETRDAFREYFTGDGRFDVHHFALFRSGRSRLGDNALIMIRHRESSKN